MAPAPPPPPPPPSNLTNISAKNSSSKPTGLPNTSALLKSIEKGTKLKKTVTNDRSAPLVLSNSNKSSLQSKNSRNNGLSDSANSTNSASLGGLFSNGFPTLRSTNNNNNRNQSKSNPVQNVITESKKPINSINKNINENISLNPERAIEISRKGIQIMEPAIPVITAEVKKQAVKSVNSANGPKDLKGIGKKLGEISISALPGIEKSELKSSDRWDLKDENEKNIPSPRKFTGCKKKYLSQMNSERNRNSKSGVLISEEDIRTFINTLKSKLNKAASEENFEECVRLKKKLYAFEVIENRIKSGNQIFASELPT